MSNAISRIICGDCREVLPRISRKPTLIFGDPPDNLGLKYEGFRDRWPNEGQYIEWLGDVMSMACDYSDIVWLSINVRWQLPLFAHFPSQSTAYIYGDFDLRSFIWHYTFGQNSQKDFTPSYRVLLRAIRPPAVTYPDAIRVKSARQTKYNDKRANPKGRVPDDVWEFPRVCGTFKEKRRWHPNQHPEALIARIVKFSAVPGDLVVDMFGGTGTTLRVCKRLGIDCIGIEISETYCRKIAEETGAELRL
jgi:site-specific DNA-methyltransferase (adenine-specific)